MSIPTNPQSTFQQQKKIALLRRQLAENDMQFCLLKFERAVLLAEIEAAVTCYQDALGADRLTQQGAAAVAEACAVWGQE